MLKGSLMAKIAVSPLVSARLYQPILSSDPYQEPRCFSNPKTFGSWLRPVRFLRRGGFNKLLLPFPTPTSLFIVNMRPEVGIFYCCFADDFEIKSHDRLLPVAFHGRTPCN